MPLLGGDRFLGKVFQIMGLNLKLTGYYRGEFEEAKADQVKVLWLQVVTVLLSAVAILVPTTSVTYITSVLAIAGTFAWNYLNTRGFRRKAAAERARRALMLIAGLGRQLSGKEISDILGRFTVSEKKAEKWIDSDYFDSTEMPGAIRFARMMQQSAFWSKELYKHSATAAWTQVAIAVVLTLAFLLVLPLFSGARFLIQIAQIVCLGLTLFVTRDLIGKALAYNDATNSLNQLDEKLEMVVASAPSEADILSIFGDYNSIVECTPLISSRMYHKHNPRIEVLWAIRSGKQTAQTGQATKT